MKKYNLQISFNQFPAFDINRHRAAVIYFNILLVTARIIGNLADNHFDIILICCNNICGTVVKGGALQGYLVSKRDVEKFGIKSLDDFKRDDVKKAFDANGDGKADLVACPPGWGCEKVIAPPPHRSCSSPLVWVGI